MKPVFMKCFDGQYDRIDHDKLLRLTPYDRIDHAVKVRHHPNDRTEYPTKYFYP